MHCLCTIKQSYPETKKNNWCLLKVVTDHRTEYLTLCCTLCGRIKVIPHTVLYLISCITALYELYSTVVHSVGYLQYTVSIMQRIYKIIPLGQHKWIKYATLQIALKTSQPSPSSLFLEIDYIECLITQSSIS